jgi:cysteine desulfurase
MHMDLAGVAASGGSACATGAIDPSHVLLGMQIPRDLAVGAVRFSFGRETTEAEVDRAAQVLPGIIARVRRVSEVTGHG